MEDVTVAYLLYQCVTIHFYLTFIVRELHKKKKVNLLSHFQLC